MTEEFEIDMDVDPLVDFLREQSPDLNKMLTRAEARPFGLITFIKVNVELSIPVTPKR